MKHNSQLLGCNFFFSVDLGVEPSLQWFPVFLQLTVTVQPKPRAFGLDGPLQSLLQLGLQVFITNVHSGERSQKAVRTSGVWRQLHQQLPL